MGFRRPNRRAVAALAQRASLPVAVVALAAALAGCGANFNAATNQPIQPAEGTSDRSGLVYVINALVVADDDGNGTVVARLINQNPDHPDALVSYAVSDLDGAPQDAAPLDEPIVLAQAPSPDQSVLVGPEPTLRATGDAIVAGYMVSVDFQFDRAAPVTLEVPVVSNTGFYADIPVEPATPPTDG